jgi:hypothetical protein
VDTGNGKFRWIATVQAPPGRLRFTFRNDKGEVVLSQSIEAVDGEHEMNLPVDMPFQASSASEWVDPDYSIQFQADWKQVSIPTGIACASACIKRLVFGAYVDICVLFALVSLFHSSRHIHSDDVAYLISIDKWEPVKNLTRSGVIQTILEIVTSRCKNTNMTKLIVAELSQSLEQLRQKDHSMLLKNKNLVDSPLLQRAVSEWRRRYNDGGIPEVPHISNEAFLTWLERVHNTLGTESFLACGCAS